MKWFCAFDVAGQPRGLENVLCPDFEYLIGLSVIALLAGALFEGTHIGLAMQRSMDRVTAPILDRTELMFRAGTAFFFIAVWGFGGVLLTPELKTDSTLIGAIQLGIAAGMLSRRTMPLSALGIVVLYAVALYNYGLFHLLDYPVFLGVAAYLALTGLQRDFFGIKAIDIVRWTAGITLMWASIEKWAYPEWTYPLLTQHPGMTLGFDTDFYMRSAGAVEFALAFALVTPALRDLPGIGLALILWSFAVVWLTDIAAYFTVRRLGGPKLMPAVSPKKTWSGAIGGALAGMIGGYLVWRSVPALAGLTAAGPVIAASFAGSVVSQAGGAPPVKGMDGEVLPPRRGRLRRVLPWVVLIGIAGGIGPERF